MLLIIAGERPGAYLVTSVASCVRVGQATSPQIHVQWADHAEQIFPGEYKRVAEQNIDPIGLVKINRVRPRQTHKRWQSKSLHRGPVPNARKLRPIEAKPRQTLRQNLHHVINRVEIMSSERDLQHRKQTIYLVMCVADDQK